LYRKGVWKAVLELDDGYDVVDTTAVVDGILIIAVFLSITYWGLMN
jgi:hypothetical protein